MTPVRTLRRVAVALLASVAAGAGFALDNDSVEELSRAAELGDSEAQFDLGYMYTIGIGDFEADSAEALRWYRRSAEQGFARAQSVLGSAYAHGHSLEQDFTQAATWCRLGAEQGDAEGQLCMALLYAGGCGVKQDDTESARWYRLAADQGEGQAQARLGDMYANGEGGVQQDPVEADKWYRRAVEPGTYHPKKVAGFEFFSGRPLMIHLFVLARMYRNGTGVPQNDVAAYKWFDISNRWRSHGSDTMTWEAAQTELDDLAKEMTSAQVADAQRAADAFLETYRIDSYESWRNLALTGSLPEEAGEQRVLGTLWWYPAARMWYPVARWWWRTTAAIRATISPPVIPDALMTTGSSGTPACMAGTITSADT